MSSGPHSDSQRVPPARGAPFARGLALATMVLVTAWSLWAWAQQKPVSGAITAGPESHEPAHESTREGEGHPAMNWTRFGERTPPFIAMLVNFGILVAGYVLLGRKPVAEALRQRRDTIVKEIDDAQRIKREAEERAKTYQAKLERLEEETRTAREALVRAGYAERDRILAEAEARAERLRKETGFLVEQELKQMRQDLWRDAVGAAVETAGELLRQRITQADQDRLAEVYLVDISSMNKGASGERAESREVAP